MQCQLLRTAVQKATETSLDFFDDDVHDPTHFRLGDLGHPHFFAPVVEMIDSPKSHLHTRLKILELNKVITSRILPHKNPELLANHNHRTTT